jgi:hypothetical protein
MIKWKAIILVPILALAGLAFFKIHFPKDGFLLEKLEFDFPHHEEWEIPPLDSGKQKQLNDILLQKFTYLGKGRSSVSFISEDEDYVLKFFKSTAKVKKAPLERALNGYKIAYDNDPAGTGLLYIHLNKTQHQHPIVSLIDKTGKEHQLNLDHTYFVVQQKVHELQDLLQDLLEQQKIELAKQRLHAIFDLYLSHYQKGLFDLGVGILRNNGFNKDQPIHFDVSKMTLDKRICDSTFQQERMQIMIKKIDLWILKHYPQYHQEIVADLADFS